MAVIDLFIPHGMGGKEIGTCHNKIGQEIQALAATADFRKGLSFEHEKKRVQYDSFQIIRPKRVTQSSRPTSSGPTEASPNVTGVILFLTP